MNNTLEFNGSNTFIEVPLAPPTNNGDAMTIEFWNHATEYREAFAFLFSDGEGLERTQWIGCQAPWHNGTIYWDCGDLSKGRVQAPYSRDYLNKWTHIALVTNGTNRPGYQAIYINGTLVKSQNRSVGFGKSYTTLLIGAGEKWHSNNHSGSYTKDWFYKGMIDEFRVWDHMRSPEEIRRHMHAQMVGDEPGLVANFSFNWGFQNYAGSNLWGEKLNKLPNSVSGSADGKLYNFSPSNWVDSDLVLTAAVGPVYRLKNSNGTRYFYTTKPAEKTEKIAANWVDDGIAFYAHRAAAPGTVPLHRLRHKTSGQHMLTADRAERQKFDTRSDINDTSSTWADEGEIAFVSAVQNGQATPLYRSRKSTADEYQYTTDYNQIEAEDNDPGVLCYVLPTADSRYEPQPISFMENDLSEQLWYVLQNRSLNEKWGLQFNDQFELKMAELPAAGQLEQFQWRILDNRLINRATGLVLEISGSTVKVDRNENKSGERWSFTNIPLKGTDCFKLVQSSKALSCNSQGAISAVAEGTAGATEHWTLRAMEPIHGYTIPGPPAGYAAYPFSKHLETRGVHIIGTGTVSDWAMLRVKLIIENMLEAVKDVASISKMRDKEVFVVSRDESNAELAQAPCLGLAWNETHHGKYRGSAGSIGVASFCLISEELMWKTGVFNNPATNPSFRKFDQVIHEFAHVMDHVLGFNGDGFPKATTDGSVTAREALAGKIQSWFDSIGTVHPNSHYNPGTRAELERNFVSQYNHLSMYLDPDNTWMPPVEFRDAPDINQPINYLIDMKNDSFTFMMDEEYFSPNAKYCLRFQRDGNFVIYDEALKPIWAAPTSRTWRYGKRAEFTSDGKLVVYGSGNRQLWYTRTGKNPGARLHLTDEGKLIITDAQGQTLWSSRSS